MKISYIHPHAQARTDVETLDVEQEAVGFLLGAKGATLRGLETKHKTFMFFDNEKTEVCIRVLHYSGLHTD